MKRMKKRLPALALAFVLAFGNVSAVLAEDADLQYEGPSDIVETQSASPAALSAEIVVDIVPANAITYIDIAALNAGDACPEGYWTFNNIGMDNVLEIRDGADVTITGSRPGTGISVSYNATATITFSNLILDETVNI